MLWRWKLNQMSTFHETDCSLSWEKACHYGYFLISSWIFRKMKKFASLSVFWYMAVGCTHTCPIILKDTLLSSKATGQELKGFRKLSPMQNIPLCFRASTLTSTSASVISPHNPSYCCICRHHLQKPSFEQQPLCVPGGGIRGSLQWQMQSDSPSFHDWRILMSRTRCETPWLRICLCGDMADLLLRAFNKVWQWCKMWRDMLLLSSMLHNTTLQVGEWSWFLRCW